MPILGERTAAPATRGRLIGALLLGVLAIVGSLPGGFWPLDVRTQILLDASLATVLCFAGLVLIHGLPDCKNGLARWRFGPWYLMWGGFTFGLASFTWLEPPVNFGSAARIALPSVVLALGIFTIATTVWLVGYVAGVPRPVREGLQRGLGWLLHGTTPELRGTAALWALYALASTARLATATISGRYGYLGDPSGLVNQPTAYAMPLDIVSQLSVFAIAAAAYRAFDPANRGGKITLWTLVTIEAVVGAAAGGKQSFIIAMLAVLVPYGARRGHLPLRILLPGLFLYLWLVIPFNTEYRQVVRSKNNVLSPAAAVAGAPKVLGTILVPQAPLTALSQSVNALLHRARNIDNTAIIVQMTPAVIPYRNPAEFATAPIVGLIPRALWADKPVFATGYVFSQEYYGTPATVYTSAAVTPLGDLYRHGGLPVVVVGMLLLGMACRALDQLLRAESDPRAICFLLVFLPIIVKAEMDVYTMILAVPSGIIAATLGARLIYRRRGT
jgi:hypothetical protein